MNYESEIIVNQLTSVPPPLDDSASGSSDTSECYAHLSEVEIHETDADNFDGGQLVADVDGDLPAPSEVSHPHHAEDDINGISDQHDQESPSVDGSNVIDNYSPSENELKHSSKSNEESSDITQSEVKVEDGKEEEEESAFDLPNSTVALPEGDWNAFSDEGSGEFAPLQDNWNAFSSGPELQETDDTSWAAFGENDAEYALPGIISTDLNQVSNICRHTESGSDSSGSGNSPPSVEDDDFGDFEDISQPAATIPVSAVATMSAMCTKIESALMKLLSECFLEETSENTSDRHDKLALDTEIQHELLETELIYENIQQLKDAQASLSKEAKSVPATTNVWKNLMDLENSPTIKFMWTQCTFYEAFLKVINIDARNVLMSRKQAVPIFASQLGLLEPCQAPVDHDVDDPPVPSSCSLTAPNSSSNCSSGEEVNTMVPQFDWSSSGLTNPLDQLEAEFLAPLPRENDTTQGLPADARLKDILAAAASPVTRDSGHSETTLKFLRRLPDLSYMRSKVLMFPIHSDSS